MFYIFRHSSLWNLEAVQIICTTLTKEKKRKENSLKGWFLSTFLFNSLLCLNPAQTHRERCWSFSLCTNAPFTPIILSAAVLIVPFLFTCLHSNMLENLQGSHSSGAHSRSCLTSPHCSGSPSTTKPTTETAATEKPPRHAECLRVELPFFSPCCTP